MGKNKRNRNKNSTKPNNNQAKPKFQHTKDVKNDYISILEADPVTSADREVEKAVKYTRIKADLCTTPISIPLTSKPAKHPMHLKEKTPEEKKRFVYNIIFIVLIVIAVLSALYIVYTCVTEYREAQISNDLSALHNSLTGTTAVTAELEADVYDDNLNYSPDADYSGVTQLVGESETSVASADISSIDNEDIQLDTTEEVQRDPLKMSSEMGPLYAQNSDTVGWLTLGGTKIDNVVVQTTDNEFYLSHNFKREISQPGTLFVDYRCNISDYDDLQSSNILIYGHKQKSGSMFGTLNYYHNSLDFYKLHPTFTFSNLYKTYTYKIIAMFTCKTLETPLATEEDVFDYQNYINFHDSGKYTFANFITNIKQRSELNTPVSFTPNDNYMILSTCAYDYVGARFVVIARRVRDGESTDVDVDKATVNNYKLVD
jgi:sortase B